MQQNTFTGFQDIGSFASAFYQLISREVLDGLWHKLGPKPRGHKPTLSGPELVMGLVFHVLTAAGTLAAHVRKLTGISLSNSALSQRR